MSVRHGSTSVGHGSMSVGHGSTPVRHGSASVGHDMSARHGSTSVGHGIMSGRAWQHICSGMATRLLDMAACQSGMTAWCNSESSSSQPFSIKSRCCSNVLSDLPSIANTATHLFGTIAIASPNHYRQHDFFCIGATSETNETQQTNIAMAQSWRRLVDRSATRETGVWVAKKKGFRRYRRHETLPRGVGSRHNGPQSLKMGWPSPLSVRVGTNAANHPTHSLPTTTMSNPASAASHALPWHTSNL